MLETRKETVWLILIYCAAHLPLLAATGQRYDDWVLLLADSSLNVEIWTSTGRPLTGPFLNVIRDVGGVFLARVCSFLAYLLAGLLLADILRKIPFVEPPARFMVTAFFMVFPADSTRILPMLAYDSFCYFLFFLGFWLVSRYMESQWILTRIAAICAFFLSFWLNSLLVLYLLPLCFVGYRELKAPIRVHEVAALMIRYADFLSIPLVFWVIQRVVFPPSGLYAAYNQPSLAGLSPRSWVAALKGALVDPTVYSVLPLHAIQILAVIAGACALFFLWRNRLASMKSAKGTDLVLLGVGLILVLIALFPYILVRKTPGYWDWSSRHSRLVPLGAGLMLYYGLKVTARWIKAKEATLLLVCCFLLCVFVSGNVKTYGGYWVDWYKNLALIEQFKLSEIVKNHTSFLFIDDASQFNARKRWYRFYEYAALMSTAFGDEEKRFGNDEKHWRGPHAIDETVRLVRGASFGNPVVHHSCYRLSQWKPTQPQYRVTILPTRDYPGVWEVMRLKWSELWDKAAFAAAPPRLVRLEYQRIDTTASSSE